MSANISKIIVEVNGKKVELTLDEAKELGSILGEMFGLNLHYTPTYPIVYPVPVWREPYRFPYYTVTWDGNNTVYCLSSSSSTINPSDKA